MREKFCLPIIKPTARAVLATIQENRRRYAFFEVWIDYITDLDDALLSKLIHDLDGKLLIVFRRQNLEPMHLSLARRQRIIQLCAGTRVLVDLDFSSQSADLSYISRRGLKICSVVSYHNYISTPDTPALRRLSKSMLAANPTILKIATMCHSEYDALRLLELLLNLKQQNQHHIILGMGPAGVITRIFGTLWGNELVFAPNDGREQSAPGQLTRGQLINIDNILKGQHHGR